MTKGSIHPSIHPFFVLFSYTGSQGALGLPSAGLKAQGRGLFGWNGDLTQGIISHTNKSTLWIIWKCHSSLWTEGRNFTEYTEETPITQGEHANSAHREGNQPPTLEVRGKKGRLS